MITAIELANLERRVDAALAGGPALTSVLGFGEISLVVGWPESAPRWACKRLPLFPDLAAVDVYQVLLERYFARLATAKIQLVPTTLHRVVRADGRVAAYCVQPVFAHSELATEVLRRGAPNPDHPLLQAVIGATLRLVTPRVGLDAQLSNWIWRDGELHYLDVTTPLLRHPDGRPELDSALFLAAYPWALRAAIRYAVLPSLLQRYHDPRTVLRDMVANLFKERLVAWIPAMLEAVNRQLSLPLTTAEVASDYRLDARMWAWMLRLRRLDRAWQRHVRRRPYPFLLPPTIAR